MSKPVTRGGQHEALDAFEKRFGETLEAKLAKYATSAHLETWGGALSARTDTVFSELSTRIDKLESKVDGLYGELARHTQAILEAMSTQISAVDDKYADLPARVSRLERDAARPRRR